MDDAWLAVLADKDYLFAADWPLYAWLTNLGYAALLAVVYTARRRAGVTTEAERALVIGLWCLVAAFLVSVPLTEVRVALAVQLQVNRIFWLLDFVAAVYLAWWIAGRAPSSRYATRVAVLLLALAAGGRGAFLLTVTHADRVLIERDFPDTAWSDALGWVGRQGERWHVLADPGHAWKYGPSVRAVALMDTVLETGKDSAMAMYDRDIAMRVADRMSALGGFEHFTTDDIRALDVRYAIDLAVVDVAQPLDLPVLYRNSGFVVYDLR